MVRETSLLLKILQFLLGFAPWIVAFAVPDFRYGCTAALGLTGVAFAFEFFLYRTERTMVFPKVLNIIELVLFVALTILSWADMKNDAFYKDWATTIVNGGMAIGSVVATLCGRPFVADYVADKTDEATGSHPTAKHLFAVMNLVIISMLVLVASVDAVGALAMELMQPPPGLGFKLAFRHPAYLTWIIIALCIAFNFAFYKYLLSPRSEAYKIAYARRHDKEFREWAEAHPDHVFAKKYHKRKFAEAAEAAEDGRVGEFTEEGSQDKSRSDTALGKVRACFRRCIFNFTYL